MPDEYRAALEKACAHALKFHESLRQRCPKAPASIDELRVALDGPTPERGTAATEVIDQLASAAEPGLMGMAGPRFFAWVVGASHPSGVAADWLTSIWGQNGAGFQGSPANAVAEHVASRWLLDLIHLPSECSVGFTTGATMANFVCLAAARGKVLNQAGWNADADGLFGAPPIHVYVGSDAHVAVFSALRYLGLGHNRVVRIPTDDAGRMMVHALNDALAMHTGPRIVITQAGQINTGAFDPFDEIVDLSHRYGAWVHVDGAFGLWARACPARMHLTTGIEKADSWATDGHKWLQTPYDCGYAIVRDTEAHRRAMAIEASFLPTARGDIREPFLYVPELSRRARGFSTWAIIRTLGRQGIAAMIERHCVLAQRMANRLASEPGVAVLNEVELNQIVVQFGIGEPPERRDQLTREVIVRTQAAGICYVAEAHWKDRWVMRFCVISWPTTEQDIDVSAESIINEWRQVRAG